MKYRIRVEKVSGAGRELEVEVFAETEACADAAGWAFLKAYPKCQVFKEDLGGEGPPEFFFWGFPDWHKALENRTPEQETWLREAMTPMNLVEPGSPHDVVDLSRLA